jgi:hypothetical protein
VGCRVGGTSAAALLSCRACARPRSAAAGPPAAPPGRPPDGAGGVAQRHRHRGRAPAGGGAALRTRAAGASRRASAAHVSRASAHPAHILQPPLSSTLPSTPACRQELLLAGNQLSDAGLRELVPSLARLPHLRLLGLADNPRLGGDGVGALAAALRSLPRLQELHLARASAGNEGARHLAKARGGGARMLPQAHPRRRATPWPCLPGQAGSWVRPFLSPAAPQPHLISSIPPPLCGPQALPGHPSLTALDMEACRLRADGAAHLAAALAAAPSPPAPASAAGSPSDAPPLVPVPGLARLVLARNPLGDRGAAALAEGLCRNASLRSLDLRGCGLGLAGCRALAGALRERNAGLRELALGGNEAEEAVAEVRALRAGGPAGRWRPLAWQPLQRAPLAVPSLRLTTLRGLLDAAYAGR